ncbi:MAG: hypothetical protein AABW89_00830 [Nanoarchaeota archaeon]
MLSVRNRIIEALPKVQPVLEEMLDLNLGEIEIKHGSKRYWEIFDRTFEIHFTADLQSRGSRFFTHCLTFPVALVLSPILAVLGVFAAGDSTIYYSNNPVSLILPRKSIEGITAHELAHIAHGKLTNESLYGEKLHKLPRYVKEGFAEHTARRVISRIYHEDEEITGGYDKYVEEFRKELQRRGYNEEKDLVKAIRELSQV